MKLLVVLSMVPNFSFRGGNVIFVSSVGGYQPMQGLGPYCVSKTALLGLTRALAPELAHSNIRVNCVAPGIIKTRFSSATVIVFFFSCSSCGKTKTLIGEPEEIGGTIAFLCSDDASYITGETVTVTGGMSCRL
uniref:Dehydrogenase/reductase (SDR family) member 4 n=1 Tax=Poecilia reticulata TaxID=8081 RepID=A0A3P9NBF8_POERE